MLEITAWSLVVSSFLLIGIFGYASVWREPQSIALELGRPVFMLIGAAVSANFLNTAAYRIFTRIDVDTFKQYGSIQDDQMQPDMPNLMTGLIMFGWVFFVAGLSVSRSIRTRAKNHDSEPATDGNHH